MAIAIVVVLVAIGGVGYMVYKNQKKSSSSASNTAATNAIGDECNKLYKDKDLCKFSSHYDIKGAYTATFTSTDKDGKATEFTSAVDGKDNSSTTTKEGGKESGAFIMLNGDTYMKDEGDGSWIKYPKGPDVPKTDTPTSNLKVDFKDEGTKPEASRITYKKLGKESCAKLNCFKYQVIDPAQPGTTSIIWFGDKDYTLHKWSFTDKDGSKSVGEFTFGAINITVPSPVKDAPSVPNAAELQNMIDQAQAQ